ASGKRVEAAAKRSPGKVGSSEFQRGKCEHRFDQGSGGIVSAHRSIEQRLVQVELQRVVLAGTHSQGKCIRIERRRADKRQDLPVCRVYRDDRSTLPIESSRGDSLQVEVQAQVEVVGRLR